MSWTRAAIARGYRCMAGRSEKIAASRSGSNSASSAAVGSWPSRRTRSSGPLNAFSSVTCWSSSMAMSRASGLRLSSSLASGSTGIQIVTAPSVLRSAMTTAFRETTAAKILLMPRCPIS